MNEEVNIPNNLEIDKALKEFEAKAYAEQTQKNLEISKNSDTSKMVQLVMKLSGGTIKEQKQAELVLLVFAIIVFAVSLFLFFGGGSQDVSIPPMQDIVTSINFKKLFV